MNNCGLEIISYENQTHGSAKNNNQILPVKRLKVEVKWKLNVVAKTIKWWNWNSEKEWYWYTIMLNKHCCWKMLKIFYTLYNTEDASSLKMSLS